MEREGLPIGARLEKRRSWRRIVLIVAGCTIAILVAAGWFEASDSCLQAHYFSDIARGSQWDVQPGPDPNLWLPQTGPYDVRLGYSRIKEWLPRLNAAGYDIAAQARQSEGFRDITGGGYYPIYREKSQAGLTVLDRDGKPLYASRFPRHQYASYEAIPPVLVAALLYVENRNLLDSDQPTRNPAVDWGRFARAALGQAMRAIDVDEGRAGGSTLATQIEKFRHSPGGRTRDTGDKLTQMISASLRAYQDGTDTMAARRRIVLDYFNSVPLAGLAGYGEVNGLGDGLWAWYGRRFDTANRLLTDPNANPALRARVFKEALSLIVAQRRPSDLLLDSTERLDELTNSYLRLLTSSGGIPDTLRDEALQIRLVPARNVQPPEAVSFVERKAVNHARGVLGNSWTSMISTPSTASTSRPGLRSTARPRPG